MGQTSSQLVAPAQASQATHPPAIARKPAVKRRLEQSNMDSNNVASNRPSKKRRKSAEEHQEEVQSMAGQGEQLGAHHDAVHVAEQDSQPRNETKKNRKKKKRKIVPDAPEEAAPVTRLDKHIGDDALASDAVEVAAARSKEEKRQTRRAKKAARKAREVVDAQAEDVLPTEAKGEFVDIEDVEVTELPTDTTPTNHEPPKSPTGVEWGRQEVRRILKRKQMEELVLSGRARWHRLPSDKWSIRFYQPGEAPAPAPLSPEQKRRYDVLKQEIARYEHTLRMSEEKELKGKKETEKENVVPVEEDAVAGAAEETHEEAMSVSSAGKSGPKRKKRRQSQINDTPDTEAVSPQPDQDPGRSTSRQSTSGERQEDDARQTASRRRKDRRHADSEGSEEAEATSERPERPVRAPRPIPSIKNEERPRKKRKRAEIKQSTSGNASPERSQELTQAPAVPTPRADNGYASIPSRKSVSAERVRTWLDGDATSAPAPTEISELRVGSEQEGLIELANPRKKRNKSTDAAGDEAGYASQADMESLSGNEEVDGNVKERKSKKLARTKTRRVSTEKHQPLAKSLQLAVPEATSGAFTVQEQEISDRIFDEVLERHNCSEAELKAMIKSWRNAGPFKMEMEAALPNRRKDQIRKFCQRRYHAHERGPWTAEQDQALLDAHAKWPGKWSQIADLVDRFAQDCKDRWTNHLQSGGNKEVGPWNQAEEDALVNAVKECIAKIKKSRRKDNALSRKREDLEALVDWKTVADMLGGKRAGKRCREKYHKLMTRLTKTGSLSQELPASQLQDELDETVSKKSQHRDVSAQKALENFEIGDYYDAFVEVHTAIKDHSAQYHNEQTLLWSIVAQQHPASRFNVSYLGAALRRKAIEKALDEWEIDSKKTRRKLDEAPSIPAQALLLAKWVEKRSADKLDTLPRRYMPELIGKTKEEIRQFKKDQQEQRRTKKSEAGVMKSKDYVTESSEDEDGAPSTKADEKPSSIPDDGDESSRHSDAVVHESQEGDRPRPVKDRSSSSRRKTRSSMNDDKDEDHEDDDHDEAGSQLEIEERNQEEPLAAHEVSDTEIDSTHEKVFAASQAARATEDAQEVPETQPEPARADGGEASRRLAAQAGQSLEIGTVVSSANSRMSNSPSQSSEDFLQRCREAGRSQHGEYASRNRRTYGRQSSGRQR